VESSVLITLTNEFVFLPIITQLSMNQIAGLFWVYRSLSSYSWDPKILDPLEERISKLLRHELSI
jgi:hypothetical protein